MLHSLSIRDIVLIEALDLDFTGGLTVLTGETGAGKSILLDALGFVLGRRAGRELVRAGATSGSVTAVFRLEEGHPADGIRDELGLPAGEELILRRVAATDGPSRAFVNDRRVSADAMARLGQVLVEVHGQHDDRSLLDPRAHRALLDAFGGHEGQLSGVRAGWASSRAAAEALAKARAAREKAEADADWLRHSVAELEKLAPEPGEDATLDAERRLIRQAAGLGEEITRAAEALSEGASAGLGDALHRLTRLVDRAGERLEAAISALDRTMAELSAAESELQAVLDDLRFDPDRLDQVEERLFAIRGMARKHSVAPDELAELAVDLSSRLTTLDDSASRIASLESAAAAALAAYDKAAAGLGAARTRAAAALDEAVTAELAPLRMGAARFLTRIGPADPGPDGTDTVRFTATINPGTPAGPIDRIASGGELSRFLLALKVQLAAGTSGLTMVFDEIDRGIGGATADAVGRRLVRLAHAGQVLVVTHSPQVAALGDHHLRIAKQSRRGETRTEVVHLDAAARHDEIARMLAGDRVTDEAREAARALMAQATGGRP